MNPKCPKCGAQMAGGAPPGNWPIQYECRRCNVFITPPANAEPPPRDYRYEEYMGYDDDYDPRG